MAKIANLQEVAVNDLKPYGRNAKIHGKEQIEKLKKSIEGFGFLTPCLIDRQNNLIAGHGRVMAAKELGMEKVPCVLIEDLTEEERRAYILADNRLSELGAWDFNLAYDELADLGSMSFDVELTGFDLPETAAGFTEWTENREKNDARYQEGNEEYNDFLDKFEQPKTTDDCYTPEVVYEAVAGWVAETFGVDRQNFVRPFYPGGDYQAEPYKPTDVVVDNPPFSILAEITRFYKDHGVRYFLFAPGLTLFSADDGERCAICLNAPVTYENKATVSTSFLTNMIPGYVAISCPELFKRVKEANDQYVATMRADIPKYSFPPEVVTATKLGYLSKYGQEIKIRRAEAYQISALDAMKEHGKGIYGNGFLVSAAAAAEKVEKERLATKRAEEEKAAAEEETATAWPLSDREREIVRKLG